jgi:hypothetical protein
VRTNRSTSAPWTPTLGPLERLFNTPAHHRVHHASNPGYLDANFGGVLIVFDRCFGTLRREIPGVAIRYGLVQPIRSYNPLRVGLHEWAAIARDVITARAAGGGSRRGEIGGCREPAHRIVTRCNSCRYSQTQNRVNAGATGSLVPAVNARFANARLAIDGASPAARNGVTIFCPTRMEYRSWIRRATRFLH